MRLPDPSRDPQTLLICGSRTPAGILCNYSLSLVTPVLTRHVCELPPNCVGEHSDDILLPMYVECTPALLVGVLTPYQPLKRCKPVKPLSPPFNSYGRGTWDGVVPNYLD